MIVSMPLALVFGVIGVFLDKPRWPAVIAALIALLLTLPALMNLAGWC